MGGRRVRCRRTGLRSRTCSTCLQRSAGVECSLTPKGDLRANQGVMAMSREVAAAPSWRYRSGSQKLTMSTSRTARRPTSGAPVHPFAALRFAPFRLGRPAFAALPLTPNHSIKHNLSLQRSLSVSRASRSEHTRQIKWRPLARRAQPRRRVSCVSVSVCRASVYAYGIYTVFRALAPTEQ